MAPCRKGDRGPGRSNELAETTQPVRGALSVVALDLLCFRPALLRSLFPGWKPT